jgi:hypothetical protein
MARRYLLVLDMDLLAVDEQLGLEPISYLLARQQEQPCEVVVLSLADHRQARLPALELLLGTKLQHHQIPGSAPARSQHRCGGRASHEPVRAPPEADRLPGERLHQRRRPGYRGAHRNLRPPL